MKPKRGMTPCNIRLLEAENFSQHAVFRAANTTGLRILSGSIYFTHSFRSDIRLPFCKKTVYCQNAFTSGDSRVSQPLPVIRTPKLLLFWRPVSFHVVNQSIIHYSNCCYLVLSPVLYSLSSIPTALPRQRHVTLRALMTVIIMSPTPAGCRGSAISHYWS